MNIFLKIKDVPVFWSATLRDLRCRTCDLRQLLSFFCGSLAVFCDSIPMACQNRRTGEMKRAIVRNSQLKWPLWNRSLMAVIAFY